MRVALTDSSPASQARSPCTTRTATSANFVGGSDSLPRTATSGPSRTPGMVKRAPTAIAPPRSDEGNWLAALTMPPGVRAGGGVPSAPASPQISPTPAARPQNRRILEL